LRYLVSFCRCLLRRDIFIEKKPFFIDFDSAIATVPYEEVFAMGWSTYRTMDGSQEWLSRTRVGSRAQPTGRMVASSQDWPGSAYRHRHRLGYLGCSLHRRGRHMEEQLDRTVQVLSIEWGEGEMRRRELRNCADP
jgi:hypothetical protein